MQTSRSESLFPNSCCTVSHYGKISDLTNNEARLQTVRCEAVALHHPKTCILNISNFWLKLISVVFAMNYSPLWNTVLQLHLHILLLSLVTIINIKNALPSFTVFADDQHFRVINGNCDALVKTRCVFSPARSNRNLTQEHRHMSVVSESA